MRKHERKGNLASGKFTERFGGPYVVTVVIANEVIYQIRHCVTGREFRAHYVQLCRYIDPPDYIVNHPYFEFVNGGAEELLSSEETSFDESPGMRCLLL